MTLSTFDELFAAADRLPAPVRLAAVGAADPTVLEALAVARERGWVEPLLFGPQSEIVAVAAREDADLAGMEIVDCEEPAVAAVAAVRAGRAEALMKGQIATPELMRAILSREDGLRTERCICQVVLMELPRDDRRMLLADTGVTIQPTDAQLVDIVQSSAEVARRLGAAVPQVALLAASEKVSESMPETVAAAEIERRSRLGELGSCAVRGPLSFDLAYADAAADKKRIGGEVVGAADVLVFPNLLPANLTVKAIMYTADCRFGGVLCGVACPVVFMSRADTTATRLNSLALALRLVADP